MIEKIATYTVSQCKTFTQFGWPTDWLDWAVGVTDLSAIRLLVGKQSNSEHPGPVKDVTVPQTNVLNVEMVEYIIISSDDKWKYNTKYNIKRCQPRP